MNLTALHYFNTALLLMAIVIHAFTAYATFQHLRQLHTTIEQIHTTIE
jgi:hypothetical protein